MKTKLRLVLPCLSMLVLLLAVSGKTAHADSVVTDCSSDAQLSVLLAGGGTISFNCPQASPVIVLTSTKVINTDTRIDGFNFGNYSQVTLSGNNVRRLFYVNPTKKLILINVRLSNGNSGNDYGGAVYVNGGTLEMSNAIIKDSVSGDAGGGIFSTNGEVKLDSTLLENNSATWGAAVNATGVVEINNSRLIGNTATGGGGGGISVGGTDMRVSHSLFQDNKAPNGVGGGILLASGNMTIDHSTISGNTALTNGGGIYNIASMDLQNVTISGNSAAQGGGIYNTRHAGLVNVTMSGNAATSGGGIYHFNDTDSQTLTLQNSVIAHGMKGANCSVNPGSNSNIVSQGYNLSDDTFCATYLNQTGDWNNIGASLGPLELNGSYLPTHLPQAGSWLINRGTNSAGLNDDQRRAPRPQGSANDIGAVEVCAVKPAKPVPGGPAHNSKVKGARVTLTWFGATECADKYNVTVKDAVTGVKVDGKKGIHGWSYKTQALTKGKTYKWFVQACNTVGCTKSDTWKFTVK